MTELPTPTASLADKVVAAYLRDRGYKNAESVLRTEAKIKPIDTLAEEARIASNEASIPDFVLFYNDAEANNPSAYEQSYGSLRKWIEDSLEKYKIELRTVLFPIFVHSYFDLLNRGMSEPARNFFDSFKSDHMEIHSPDIVRLGSIFSREHLLENELAKNFLSNRYCIRMSRYSFELFLAFLQDNKFMLITRLVNRHISIRVDNEMPRKDIALEEGTGITGLTLSQLNEFNDQPISLGELPKDPWLVEEIERSLKDEKSVNSAERDAILKVVKKEAAADAPSRDAVPLPTPKWSDVTKEIDEFKKLRDRVALTRNNLPSICCYTFHNTYNNLTCLEVSEDASLACAGFNDSFLKVWSLTPDKLRAIVPDSTAPNGAIREVDGEESKNLVGHSGPAYGIRVSKDNKFAVSCSEDCTARLWSLQTFSNLAVYKGHNYPVWDIDLSFDGTYFATGSYDRTARLWRTDIVNPLRIFVGHSSDVECVRFHPNCNYIATGSADSQIRLWNVQKGNCVRLLKSHQGSVLSIAFSPDGRTLASAGDDKTVKLWNLGSGKLIKTMYGHTDAIYSLSFSQDGNQLASAGADNSVRIWDPKSAETSEIRREYNQFQKLQKPYESSDAIGFFPTKKTPIFKVAYTKANVLISLGPYK